MTTERFQEIEKMIEGNTSQLDKFISRDELLEHSRMKKQIRRSASKQIEHDDIETLVEVEWFKLLSGETTHVIRFIDKDISLLDQYDRMIKLEEDDAATLLRYFFKDYVRQQLNKK